MPPPPQPDGRRHTHSPFGGASGDGARRLRLGPHPRVRADRPGAPEAVYGDLLPVLRRADLRIVNCECALTTATSPVWKSGAVFKGEPAHVAGLTAVPFDVACLAQQPRARLRRRAGSASTLRVLTRAGIETVGAGLTEDEALAPLCVRVNGRRVHIVNFSEGEDLTASSGGPGVFGWDIRSRAAQTRALQAARRRGDRHRALRARVRAVPAARTSSRRSARSPRRAPTA